MQSKIKLNSRMLPVITAVVLLMQLVDPSPVWISLLVSLGGVWLVGYLWARELSRNLHLRREIRYGWAQVGDRLEERFTLQNNGWVPALWVEIVDGSNLPGYTANQVTGVGGNSENQWISSGVCARRGLYTLGPTDLISSDPFGIYLVRHHDPAMRTLMIMPPVIPLPAIEIAPGGRSGEGRPLPNAPERSVSSGSVREYVPGDSLRYIHWRTYARQGTPFVRVFDGTPTGDWRIILDMESSVQVGTGWDSTIENSIILAASLADRGLRTGRAVGLVAYGTQLVWLKPAEGENQRWEILRHLALVEAGEHSLAETLEGLESLMKSQASLIVITPSLREDWVQSLIKFSWKGARPTVLLLDPLSFGGSQSADMMAHTLTQLGIARHVIPRAALDIPEARPGQEGAWEWRIMGRGRAVPVRKPVDQAWRELS